MNPRHSGLLAITAALALTAPPRLAAAAPSWKLAAESKIAHKASVAAFVDEKNGMTAGYAGTMYFTHDGGKTWTPASNSSACRFGLEARPGAAFSSGNRGHVRTSTDGGERWTPVADFGRNEPGQARFLSFADAKRGLIGSPDDLGLTLDGGATWAKVALPAKAGLVAAVSLADEQGTLRLRVLDEDGAIWASADAGKTWVTAPSPIHGTVFESMSTPWASLRFVGGEGVLAAFVEDGGPKGRIWRTRDGGKTWAEEPVEGSLKIGTPNLSWDGKVLTVFDLSAVRVYRLE